MISHTLRFLILFCASVLLFVWGLPNTIALRNIMLGLGSLGALYFLIKYRPFIFDWNAISLALIYCMLIWVLIHYCFFSQEPDLELSEIKSLWIRVFSGMLIATAVGALFQMPNRINGLFIFSFFGMSISVVSVYIYYSLKLSHLLTPNDFLDSFLFNRNKVGTAFFSVIDLAVGCATITYLFHWGTLKQLTLKSFGVLILMVFSLGSSAIANSKNGVGIGALLVTIFIAGLAISLFRTNETKKRYFGIAIILLTFALCGSIVLIHKKNASPGWDTLISDIQTAVQIDKFQGWRGFNASHQDYPRNTLGIQVERNTYERFAWMTAGAREVVLHPLGYGLINHQSFPRQLKADGISVDFTGSTHAGWVDLALAFGFPAILMIVSAIFVVIIKILVIIIKVTPNMFLHGLRWQFY